ncbi:SRPBCC family protein [Streptomyces sp. ITFR-6]|uniref:type II toxin-antitoxin system RatA family toxin n=1 Tax=Streptomyces sp. ITFR-6 TaxID=3075197 RepID=UPI00288A18B0|nr:SRPBCC family protein [Streptomyces sp. ITFR-6]WNI30975.1 SRPBCC family protein [Streptomyces sp. ITFR-6]
MRAVELEHHSAGVDARTAYGLVRDFGRYPELVAVVRRVEVHPGADSEAVVSDWEVDFRNGVLTWSEEDVFDDEAMLISFRQTAGDFEVFDGQWEVTTAGPAGAGCVVRFQAKFDFGLPSLAGIIDPVAERVLRETIATILKALLGGEGA